MRSIDEFQAIDRAAIEWADREGRRSQLSAWHIALFTYLAAYILLTIFAATFTDSAAAASKPVLIFGAVLSAAAFGIARFRERAWLARYNAAFERIEQERAYQLKTPIQPVVGSSDSA